MRPVSSREGYTLAGLLLLLVGASQYRVIVGQIGLIVPLPTGDGTVNVPLPAGPSGKTFLPLQRTQRPNATDFLDPAYHAGYAPRYETRGMWHTGVDMNGPNVAPNGCNADKGNPVHAVRDGVIVYAGDGGGMWGPIIVQKVMVEGVPYWVRYAHVQSTVKGFSKPVFPRTGDTVKAGQVIAGIGQGNPRNPWPCAHLHLDIFYKTPPRWGWWVTTGGPTSEVTNLFTEPMAWFARLGAVEVPL